MSQIGAWMEAWYFLEHGRRAPAWNMACDEWLLEHSAALGRPVLRTYGWDRSSVTIGYFQPFPRATPPHITVIRRPTGGALVHHHADLTFTVTLPPHHPWKKLGPYERYHCIHERVRKIFELRGMASILAPPDEAAPSGRAHGADLCFAKNSRYDILIQGEKVAGGAQRVTRDGLLHQGSIQGGNQARVSSAELRRAWESWGAQFALLELAPGQKEAISFLAESKYATDAWNRDKT